MRVSERSSLAGSERGQPGSSCTGVFGGRPGGPGWFVLVGREGMGQPCCANRGSDLEECKIRLGSIVRAGSRIWSAAEDRFLQ